MKKYMIIICLWSITSLYSQAQLVSGSKIKAAYLLQFAENIEWKHESDFRVFKIGVLGSDPDLYSELQAIQKTHKIKNIFIELFEFRALDDLTDVHMLFLSNEKCTQIKSVLPIAINLGMLVVSDNCLNLNHTMINIVFSAQRKMIFELNHANIREANLTVKSDLLLLGGGGSVALKVYKKIENSLQKEKLDAKLLKNQLLELELELHKQKKTFQLQKLKLAEQGQLLLSKESHIDSLSAKIAQKESQYSQLQLEIKGLTQYIKDQQLESNQKFQKIIWQNEIFKKNKNQLDSQHIVLRNQALLANQYEQDLVRQSSIIEMQKYGLIIELFVISLVIGIIFSIVKNYRLKKKTFQLIKYKNTTLRMKQKEISLQNQELLKQKKELMDMTLALKDQSNLLKNSVREVEQANEEIKKINENLEEKVEIRTLELKKQNTKILQYISHNSHIVRGPLSRILGLTHLFSSLDIGDASDILKDITFAAEEVDKVVREINSILEEEHNTYNKS